jgi:hypothetical protein
VVLCAFFRLTYVLSSASFYRTAAPGRIGNQLLFRHYVAVLVALYGTTEVAYFSIKHHI